MKCIAYEALKLQKRRYISVVLAVLSILYIAVLWFTTAEYESHTSDYESIRSAQQNVITRANANISGGITSGVTAYEYAYQSKASEVYQEMYEKLPVSSDPVTGWDVAFRNELAQIFVCITIIVLTSEIFIVERYSGFGQILRTCKKGRLPVSAAKLGLCMITSVFAGLFYLVLTLIVTYFRVGFSSLSEPMQYLNGFSLYPYAHTVGEYLWIHICISSVGYLLFGAIIALIASFTRHYSLSYLIGGSIYAILFAVNKADIFGRNAICSLLDLISTMKVYPLTMRYRAVNIADEPFDLTAFNIIIYVSVVIIVGCMTLVLSAKRKLSLAGSNISLPKISIRIPSPKWRPHLDLLRFEIYKQCSPKIVWLVIGITLIKCLTAADRFAPDTMYDDMVYKEYAMQLEGSITDGTYEFVERESGYINSVLDSRKEIDDRFAKGEISVDDYKAYSEEYKYAINHREPLGKIEWQLSYLRTVEESKGISVDFLYATGWELLFDSGMDFMLYLIILMISAGSFAREYDSRSSSGRFADILQTTRRGRLTTCKYKLLSAVLMTAAFYIVYQTIDYVIIFKNYYMPLSEASIFSIQSFGGTTLDISLAGYMIMMSLGRLAAVIILTVLICVFSYFTKRAFTAVIISGAITLLPTAIAASGLKAAPHNSRLTP